MQILIGDVFRCKRRGHEIIVNAISQRPDNPFDFTVYYRNIRGAMVSIEGTRLLNASRFERMPVEALKIEAPAMPQETQTIPQTATV